MKNNVDGWWFMQKEKNRELKTEEQDQEAWRQKFEKENTLKQNI